MLAVDLALIFVTASLLLFTAVFALQVFCSFLSASRTFRPCQARPRAVIIVPAHNEGILIKTTLLSIQAQMTPGDRLLVVADNCSDNTAEVARTLGAEVIERNNPFDIGKGYALAAGLDAVRTTDLHEIIVFVDADCALEPGCLTTLVRTAKAEDAPAQARYRMRGGSEEYDVRQRIGAFAWRVKTEVRPSGYFALGLPCILMGTGMAVPLSVLKRINLATGHITEDIVLSVDCALAGHAPVYCPNAGVTSDFAPSQSGRDEQKKRWCQGHLLAIMELGPKLLKFGITHRKIRLIAMAADLMIPPLGLFSAAILLFNLVAIGSLVVGGSWVPVALALLSLFTLSLSIAAAWFSCGRDLVGWKEILGLPIYLARQVTVAANLLVGDPTGWKRSERS